jgi:hypothetical protein
VGNVEEERGEKNEIRVNEERRKCKREEGKGNRKKEER